MDLIVHYIIILCVMVFGKEYEAQGMKSTIFTEDLELEKQLQLLNKPAHKTIKTTNGEIIDCIDIYKQPSLDHHLLKDHKIQMKPSSIPKMTDDGALSTTKARHFDFTLTMPNPMNCPQGTVPIRRTSKADLIRAKSFTEIFASKIHPQTILTPGRHQAIVRSVYNPNIIYKGIEAKISVYNPRVVNAKQSSFAQIWIENGPPNARNTLQAGWMVAPDLYGDNLTRSFIYWSVQGNPKRGCFNLLCKGFVHVDGNSTLGIGDVRTPSKYGAFIQYVISRQIFQDPNSGHWWYRDPHSKINIGYWPKDLFPLLAGGATQVIWGGQVFNPPNGASPGMGSGHFAENDFTRACYAAEMKVVDSNLKLIGPGGPYIQMETFADNVYCYNAQYFGHRKDSGFTLLFGGPGGDNCGI